MGLEDKKEALISKKLAAREVFKTEKKTLIISSMSIASVFIVAVIMTAYKTAGAIAAGAIAMIFGYFVVSSRKKLRYLNDTYNLGEKLR